MQLSEALEQIEGMIDVVNVLIVDNQPDSAAQAISQLRDGMQAFAGLAQRFGAIQFTLENVQRMKIISERLIQVRGHIAKMSAMNAQQLAALMPEQSIAHTYGDSKQPGSAASVARIYHIRG